MSNDTKSITGATSLAYHTTIWILAIAGLLGNLLVLVWRCSRKESRYSLTSALISSLAFADLLFCCHFLLQELMLVNIVFANDQENITIHVSTTDEHLCFSILLFGSMSGMAIMLTSVAIALATLLSFHLKRYGKRMILCFLVISWMFCLAISGLAVWNIRPSYQAMAKHVSDVTTFSLFVVYGCTGSNTADWNPFPIIGSTVNAMASLVVAVIYVYLGCKIRKQGQSFGPSKSQEISHFRIRLAIISGLNLLCWWPACFIYLFTDAKNLSVVRGTISPAASEPMLAIIAAVSVANPIIYTIASKRFLMVAQRARTCCLCFRRRNEEWLPVVGPSDARVLVCHPESVTENTDETSLFPEVD